MGFSCGIERVANKLDKAITLDDYCVINDFFRYTSVDGFYQNQFPTFEDFKNRHKDRKSDLKEEEMLKFKNDYICREHFYSIFESIESWCSDGHCFHDWIINNLAENSDTDESVRLTREKCEKLLLHCVDQISSITIEPVSISRAFKEIEDVEDDERSTFISIPCDGIEVENEDGNFRRVYATIWEESDIFLLKDDNSEISFGIDTLSKYKSYIKLLQAISRLINDTDWEHQDVFYSGGW